MPLDVADNSASEGDRLVVFVVDDMFLHDQTEAVKTIIRRLVLGLGSGVTMGLVSTSSDFGVELTRDRNRILRAVDSFEDRHDLRNVPRLDPYRFFGQLHAWKTVEDVARMVGANDGRRKAFIWISSSIEPGGGKAIGMFERLQRSGVQTIAINPAGGIPEATALGRAVRDTGGFSVTGRDLEAGIDRILVNLDNYYMLGFARHDPDDRSSFRELDVRVNRPGLTVQHARGYSPRGLDPLPRNRTDQGRLVAGVLPTSGLPLRLHAVPFFTARNELQVLVTLDVDLGVLPQPDEAGIVAESLYYEVFAASLDAKKITESAGRELEITWPDGAAGPQRSARFQVTNVLTLKPGRYQLRAAALARRLDLAGSVYLQIDVPESRGAALSVSGLALATASAGDTVMTVDEQPLELMNLPFRPTLRRAFSPDETLQVYFQVRRRSAALPVGGSLELQDGAGRTVRSVDWDIEPLTPAIRTLDLPLSGLAPGPYRLVATARSGEVSATSEVGIQINSGSGL